MNAEEAPTHSQRALVVVPTYNEKDNISEVVRRLFGAGAPVDLLVVDDGSPDGTARLVEELARDRDDIFLLERGSKQGLGTAYIAGFHWATERGYYAVVEMDADLSHDPVAVPDLLHALGDAELAIGSRYVQGGSTRNWGLVRRLLSRAANVYAGLWLGLHVHDWTSGFRAYRTTQLEALDLGSVASEGYAFQIELTWRTVRSGGRVVEVPITFVERTSGKSKMSRGIIIEALARVAQWGLGRAVDKLRRKRQ